MGGRELTRSITTTGRGLSPRSANFRHVLREVWNTESVNRAAISRRTGLSRTTISDIVNELIDLGVVEESGAGASRGGRRPILLRPVSNSRAVVGVEAGASHVDVVVMNLTGAVLSSAGAAHRVPHDVEGTVDLIEELVHRCIAESAVDERSILWMGLAVSSPLNGDDLRHVSSMTMPAWDGIDVVDLFEDRIGLPVRMDNDANLGAVAEQWWGAGRGCDDFTYIKLGVGVGAGHVVGGALYRGSGGTAGEIGHMNIGGADRCRCSRIGCMEMEVGSDAVVQSYVESVDPPIPVTIDDVVAACNAGDQSAAEIVANAGARLGTAIAPILNLLNPRKIILSGPLARAGRVFLDAVVDSVSERSLPKSVAETSIINSEFEHLTVAMGAATAALEVVFDGGADAWKLRKAPATSGTA